MHPQCHIERGRRNPREHRSASAVRASPARRKEGRSRWISAQQQKKWRGRQLIRGAMEWRENQAGNREARYKQRTVASNSMQRKTMMAMAMAMAMMKNEQDSWYDGGRSE